MRCDNVFVQRQSKTRPSIDKWQIKIMIHEIIAAIINNNDKNSICIRNYVIPSHFVIRFIVQQKLTNDKTNVRLHFGFDFQFFLIRFKFCEFVQNVLDVFTEISLNTNNQHRHTPNEQPKRSRSSGSRKQKKKCQRFFPLSFRCFYLYPREKERNEQKKRRKKNCILIQFNIIAARETNEYSRRWNTVNRLYGFALLATHPIHKKKYSTDTQRAASEMNNKSIN